MLRLPEKIINIVREEIARVKRQMPLWYERREEKR